MNKRIVAMHIAWAERMLKHIEKEFGNAKFSTKYIRKDLEAIAEECGVYEADLSEVQDTDPPD